MYGGEEFGGEGEGEEDESSSIVALVACDDENDRRTNDGVILAFIKCDLIWQAQARAMAFTSRAIVKAPSLGVGGRLPPFPTIGTVPTSSRSSRPMVDGTIPPPQRGRIVLDKQCHSSYAHHRPFIICLIWGGGGVLYQILQVATAKRPERFKKGKC